MVSFMDVKPPDGVGVFAADLTGELLTVGPHHMLTVARVVAKHVRA
jgi:hypothetical protein